jgi:DeoR/GlpR family transcriptional regulator of sugar metabolism
MTDLPHQRQEQILEWLQVQGFATVEALASQLGVSTMTIHRDLDRLAKTGLVQKVYGGVELAKPSPQTQALTCALCHAEVPARTAFMAQTPSGERIPACCSHCGLLLADPLGSALARDFIYGRMVNVARAAYVVESRVHLCCIPSILCFTGLEDAESFQRGFGGQVMTFEDVRGYLKHHHSHS